MVFFRKSDWYIASVRKSVEQAVGRLNAQGNDRKVGIQSSFHKTIIKEYDLRRGKRPGWGYWNIAAGAIEPSPHATGNEHILRATHTIPQTFAKVLFRRVSGDKHHHAQFWGPSNGLLLPEGLGVALDEWVVSIVPDITEEAIDPESPEAKRWATAGVEDWKWRVLDREYDMLRDQPITRLSGDTRTGLDLYGARLCFSEGCKMRPSVAYLYFWHCCAVLNLYRPLFKDIIGAVSRLERRARNTENPEQSLQAKEALARWEAKGTKLRAELGLPPAATRLIAYFWKDVIADVQNLNTAQDTVLDWRMEKSKYLPKKTDVVDYGEATGDGKLSEVD